MKPVKKTKKARFLQWKPTRIKELKTASNLIQIKPAFTKWNTMMRFDIESEDMIINGVRYHVANKDDNLT